MPGTLSGPGIGGWCVARIGATRIVRSETTTCETKHRGARIRTGDLCDPNAALYRTEPHPGLLG